MLQARVKDCVLEVIPYHQGLGLGGIPMGEVTEQRKEQGKKWWVGILETGRKIKIGDKLQIGCQRERMTITGVEITHVPGSGRLTIKKDGAGK